ncbi:hypothetical protein D3C72_1450340 [compost metagenome]
MPWLSQIDQKSRDAFGDGQMPLSLLGPTACLCILGQRHFELATLSQSWHAGVVTNFAHVTYISHSHGPSAGNRKQ